MKVVNRERWVTEFWPCLVANETIATTFQNRTSGTTQPPAWKNHQNEIRNLPGDTPESSRAPHPQIRWPEVLTSQLTIKEQLQLIWRGNACNQRHSSVFDGEPDQLM